MGSGGGSVGRAVASYSRGLSFESSHRRIFIKNIYLLSNFIEKTKEAENGSFFIKKSFDRLYIVHAIETFVYKSRVFV